MPSGCFLNQMNHLDSIRSIYLFYFLGNFMDIKRESIFISAVRTFCNTLVGMIAVGIILVGIVAITIFPLTKMDIFSDSDKTEFLIATDSDWNRELLPLSAPVILRLNLHGVIGTKDLNMQTIKSQLLDSRIGDLKDNRVKGLFLHINSPGGSALDSYNIYASLIEYKKKYNIPIYAYVDGLCASGGMMVACAADKIFSSPIGEIGSVGVLMGPNFNISKLMEKCGIKELTMTKGKDKDLLNPYREWKPQEEESLKEIIDYDYNIFVDIVTKARPKIDRNNLIDTYGARVYNPLKAEQYGYIDDGNSSYSHSLTELVKATDIKGEYQVITFKVIRPILSRLIAQKSPIITGKIKHEFSLPFEFPSELINRPLYLYAPALNGCRD